MQFEHSFQVGSQQWVGVSHADGFSKNRPPILCLHGWLDNAASFVPLAAELHDLPLLALDFPGHGYSSHRSGDAHYYFFDWVHDLVALCRQQQWSQLTIIGHSMGGMVATALAASFPELVSKLIVVDSLGFMTANAADAPVQLRHGIESRLSQPTSRKPWYSTLDKAATARQKKSDFALEQALLLAGRGTIGDERGFSWRADLRLRQQSVYRMTYDQAAAMLRAIQCPVLAILAEDGMFKTEPETLVSLYSNLVLKRVPGGHHCHMTCADQVATLLTDFCGEVNDSVG